MRARLAIFSADLAAAAMCLAGFVVFVLALQSSGIFKSGASFGVWGLPQFLTLLIAPVAGLLTCLPLFACARLLFAVLGEDRFLATGESPTPRSPDGRGD